MLGWWIVITRDSDEGGMRIASWEASIGGLDWLDRLVVAQKAVQTSWSGYPNLFHAKAADVFPLIESGPPDHMGLLAIGDDYVSKGGSSDKFFMDRALASACQPGDRLIIQAWDQS